MTDRSTAASATRSAALVVFGLAWVLVLLVVSVGLSYGSADLLLAACSVLLLAGIGVMWLGAGRNVPTLHAVLYVLVVVVTLGLGSTYS